MQTILIVEDSLTHMKLATLVLEKAGYRVLQAFAADEGHELARARQPALILMDVKLPGTDGLTAIRRLKADAATAGIPVIGVTSFVADHPAADLVAAGAVDCIAKPYAYKALVAAVARTLGGAAGSATMSRSCR